MELIKPRCVPQIKALRVEDFVNFIENEVEDRADYLPKNYKEITLNRQWNANLCNYLHLLFIKVTLLMKKILKKWYQMQ